MERQPTLLTFQWSNCDRCSRHASSLGGLMSSGPTLTWFEHLRLLPVGIFDGESVQQSTTQFGRIEAANSGGNRCNTPWDVPKSSRKLQTSPSTVHRCRWPPSSWYHLQKVIIQTALCIDSNKTTNNYVSIILLIIIAFQNRDIWFAPPCIIPKIGLFNRLMLIYNHVFNSQNSVVNARYWFNIN